MAKALSSTITLLAFSLIVGVASASAEPVTEGLKETADQAVSPTAGNQLADPAAKSSATSQPDESSGKTTAANQPADPMALLYADTVAPGPFEAKRKLLLASIKIAKKQGFGITSYIKELSNIEDQVKLGSTTPQLEARIDSIADGLQDQLKRSQILKSQRPINSGGRSSTSVSTVDSGASRPHRSTDQMISELRQKYGDKIPAGLNGLDNAELKEKLMKSDVAKEYLKRMGGGQ